METIQDVTCEILKCYKCNLFLTRNNIVVSRGNPHANIVIIGEAPGDNEDKQGKPFVGLSGQLLDKMLVALGLTEEDYYITNIVKCRPPGNRNPFEDEITACSPWLWMQLEKIQPDLIITLGKFSSQFIINDELPIGKLRGKIHDLIVDPATGYKIAAMATWHPAYVLRNPSARDDLWNDLKLAISHVKGDLNVEE